MSEFKVGDEVRQREPKYPFQSVEGMTGVVTELYEGYSFDIWVKFGARGPEFSFSADELIHV